MENTNEKTAGQKLQEELTWKFPSVALEAPERMCVKSRSNVKRCRLHRIRPEGFLSAWR